MHYFDDYLTRTGQPTLTRWQHYFDIFDRELSGRRDAPVSFLEIGVFKGGSLPMWRDFFHEDSSLTFVDIDEACRKLQIDGTTVEIGHQADPAFVAQLARTHGPFDIVIDDGSHINHHQIASFELFWPHMRDGSLYIVEDCHTSYWPGFGGGYRNEASFIEYAKRLIDKMHSWYTDQDKLFGFSELARQIGSIRFYDSVVVIEKQLKTGRPTTLTFENGKVALSEKALDIRGRQSVFKGRDGA